MSDEASNEPDVDQARKRIVEQIQKSDFYLGLLLDSILGRDSDSIDGSIQLSVIAQGAVVTGKAVSRRAWNELFIEGVAGRNEDARAELAKSLAAVDEHVAQSRAHREQHGLPDPPHRYLHFAESTVHVGPSTLQKGAWRVRVDQISGWCLGTYAT
ncbi:hypothetical protein [Cellulosimicrobium sp. RS]|uniref:hypothetical protein n=1 Tax=Cellulosimicrobium sp. RS TaxID=3381347 RepID=UPI0038FD1AE6